MTDLVVGAAPGSDLVSGRGPLRRLAMISLHTSPLDQPGTGDAGGMKAAAPRVAGLWGLDDDEWSLLGEDDAAYGGPISVT